MVICVVIGCSNRSGRDKEFSYFRIPAVTDHQGKEDLELRKKRRDGYLAAISREDIDVDSLDKYRICSKHFEGGKPAELYDVTNPAWLPTLHLGHEKRATVARDDSVARYERATKRNRKRIVLEDMLQQVPVIISNLIDALIEEESILIAAEQIKIGKEYISGKVACGCSNKIEALQEQLVSYKETVEKLTLQVTKQLPPFSEESFVSDEQTQFYTGLPNIKIIFEHVSKGLPSDGVTKLSQFQEFVCVLVKLRTNAANEDLCYRLNISPATVSRILLKWLKRMDIRLQELIFWPDRDALRKTMPECFQVAFERKVAVIIDCFEIFVERPSNLKARAATWSNYKHHNTVKVLLGITPQGVISFVSDSWGGRVSDKHLTENSEILRKLLPGDILLADRGFDIGESVGMMQASLHIPAFTKGKKQLSALEVEETRTIANVRIHVERVIGCVRQRFSILQSTLPIHFLTIRKGEEVPLVDRMIRVCCALNNVCNSVVPFE